MDSNIDSSIAEEEHIRAYEPQPHPREVPQRRSKYASMKEVKNFERLAEAYNQRLAQDHPTLFAIDSPTVPPLHLVCTQSEQYFLNSGRREPAHDTVVRGEGAWEVRVPVSNIQQQSVLRVEMGRLKPGRVLSVQNRRIRSGKAVRFRYTLVLAENNLLLRVWVELQGVFKVWKEMEVPLGQGGVCLEVSEFNSEQTDVKVNDYLFHLVLKMPYEEESHYSIVYEETAQIEKVELAILTEGKAVDDMDTNCSKECQLI